MRNIVYVWNYRDWGGAQIYFMSLMIEAKESYAVSALIPVDSEPKILQYLKSLEIPVDFLPPVRAASKQTSLLAKLTNHIAIHREENQLVKALLDRPDLAETIVHIDLGFWQSFLALSALCRKTHVFTTVHTGLTHYKGWRKWRWKLKGVMLSRFATLHLLTSNQEARRSLKPYVSSNKFEQIEVTYSGIDPSEIASVAESLPTKSDICRKYRLPEIVPKLLTVGQFIERKGCWILLESLKQLKDTGRDFVFVWLSTTLPDAEGLRKIESYGLGESFRLMDAEEIGETRADLLTLLSVADIFVLASLQEGLPIALIEAMAMGVACIATNVNAISEAVVDRQTGLLVQPGEPTQLCETIASLLDDANLRKKLGEEAKKTAFKRFNAATTAKRTVKLYNEVWQTPL